MLIDQELAAFIESPVMIIVGTCDGSLVPEIGRAVGALVRRDESCVDVMVSEWQWPRTVTNARAGSRLAVTFARPSDYVSFQVKGRGTVASASSEQSAVVRRYIEKMTATLDELGLDPRIVAPVLLDRNLVALRLSVEEIFVQTPGPKAGQPIKQQQ